jgi:hypothetical protein
VTPLERDGLYGKYYGLRHTRDAEFTQSRDGTPVTLREGSRVTGWYFVIREFDRHGWAALRAYADSCEQENCELAADLRRHVKEEEIARGLYDAGWER